MESIKIDGDGELFDFSGILGIDEVYKNRIEEVSKILLGQLDAINFSEEAYQVVFRNIRVRPDQRGIDQQRVPSRAVNFTFNNCRAVSSGVIFI